MPKADPTAANTAHIDANQNQSLIGVAGTLGTADVSGTAPTVPLGVNPLTGALYVQALSGTAGTTVIGGTVVAQPILTPYYYDNGTVTYPDETTEVYTFKSGTALVGTITLGYADTTKGSLIYFTRST